MIKFGIFVDGPTLISALNKIEIKVDDFEGFYRLIFDQAVQEWGQSFASHKAPTDCQLYRVYWYQIGSIDRIDLNDPKTQSYYRSQFDADDSMKRLYFPLAASKTKSTSPVEIAGEAWRLCLQDKKEWYSNRLAMLESMRTFNHAIEASCNSIEMIPCGHWKVNLLQSYVLEKGLDTAFAVDAATAAENIDVILLVAGEYDAIPSVERIKDLGRNVGVVDIVKTASSETKVRGSQSKLHNMCDFVCTVHDTDLINARVAVSRQRDNRGGGGSSRHESANHHAHAVVSSSGR